MSRVIVINDIHWTRNPPACRGPEYSNQLSKKFDQVLNLAVKLKVDALLCTGDWFHRKGRVTHRECNDLLTILNDFSVEGIKVAGIAGNHDIAGDKIKGIGNIHQRAVGVLVYSGLLQLLDHVPLELSDLYVTGTSYFHGCDRDNISRLRMYGAENKTDGKTHLHLAHGALVLSGTFFDEFSVAQDIVDLLAKHGRMPDILVSGHLHYHEGIKKFRSGITGKMASVCRPGGFSRVSRDDLDRQPRMLLIDARKGKYVLKEIPIDRDEVEAPAEPKTDEKTDEQVERIQDFVRSLRLEADQWSTSDFRPLLTKICDELDYGEGVLERAVELLETHERS